MNVLLLGCSPARGKVSSALGTVTLSELPYGRSGFPAAFFSSAFAGVLRMTVPSDVVEAVPAPPNVALFATSRQASDLDQACELLDGLSGPVLLCAGQSLSDASGSSFALAVAPSSSGEGCGNAELFDLPSGHVPSGLFFFPDAWLLRRLLQYAAPLPACSHSGALFCAAAADSVGLLRGRPRILGSGAASRGRIMTSMSFNRVTVRDGEVLKEGVDAGKIAAERGWFRQAPPQLLHLLPEVLDEGPGSGEGSYRMRMVEDSTLGEKLVFSRLGPGFWEDFFAHLSPALDALSCPLPDARPVSFSSTYLEKTLDRLRLLPDEDLVRFGPGLRVSGRPAPGLDTFRDELRDRLLLSGLLTPRRPGYVHGDLFAGNMFFSPEGGLRLIDPRGSFPECASGGDPLYDLLKLSQSFLGRYDAAWFGRLELRSGPEGFQVRSRLSPWSRSAHEGGAVRVLRLWRERSGLSPDALRLGTAVTLLSSAPLHRQEGMRHLLLVSGLSLLR